MQLLDQANAEASARLTDPQLMLVVGREGVNEIWGSNDTTIGDGLTNRWIFYYNGSEGNIAIHMDENITIETENIVFDANQTALTNWQIDSDKMVENALAAGMTLGNESIMLLYQERELVWHLLSGIESRVVHGVTGEVRDTEGDWGFNLQNGPGEGGTGSIARSSMMAGFSFEITIMAPTLYLNYTVTSPFVEYQLTLDMPRGRTATRDQLIHVDEQSWVINDPLPGMYYLNATGIAETPSMEFAWCALGYDGTDTPIWCE